MFKDLDPILHSQLRLAVISLLISVKEAEFTFLKEKTNSTAGNLSVQINKLKEAGYIDVTKQFKDNYPQTLCRITPVGVEAFDDYVKILNSYLSVNGNSESRKNNKKTDPHLTSEDRSHWNIKRLCINFFPIASPVFRYC